MGESSVKYITVKIPKNLAKEIDNALEKKTLGYRSRAEFTNEAILHHFLYSFCKIFKLQVSYNLTM